MQKKKSLFPLSAEVREILQNEGFLKDSLATGKNGYEIVGWSELEQAELYGAAYGLFKDERFQEAADAFFFLVAMNPNHPEFWLGLGMALQKLGDYEQAVDAYEVSATCKLDNPVPYFYLAKCFFAIHERDSALEALNLAIEYSGEIPEYGDLKKEAIAAKTLLLQAE